jgi:hypothetical protein
VRSKKTARCDRAVFFYFFFQVCLSLCTLTGPTTNGLSFVRRRMIIRTMTISMANAKYISGSFPLRLQKRQQKKPPGWAACVSLCWCSYFTLTEAIPTVNWFLRIRTERMTIRMRVRKVVCMSCLRFRPIISAFRNESRVKSCDFVLFM